MRVKSAELKFLFELSLLRNQKFDLISQSGWNTLTSAQSKLAISMSKDSGTLTVFPRCEEISQIVTL